MSNNVDPDETAHLDLHCLQSPIIIASVNEGAKELWFDTVEYNDT